ncbi:MAG: hypothetical protein CMF74_18630 [Maricaulis sp.]|jgi:glycosyltransferase involved in cell wall biosynthesis|nr:hypothetical protein [Maricaulis sp.]HAQ36230.1 hypothetical protein [Alphaproteobacteria bacterium]
MKQAWPFLRRSLQPARRAYLEARLGRLDSAQNPGRGAPMIAGFLSAPMGIGAAASLIHSAFRQVNITPSSFDLTPIYQPERSVLPWPPVPEPEDDGTGPVIVHVNAPESIHALSAIGAERLRGRLLIGFWAWELPQIPKSWIAPAARYHEIWVPSHFTADALRPALGDKVKVAGYPLSPANLSPELPRRLRERVLPDPDKGLLVLAAGDALSSIERKNPIGAIRAFRTAFKDREDCRMIVKTSGLSRASAAIRRRFDAECASDPRIRIFDDPLPQDEFDALFAAADVFVSLHRSEGFGLSIARALLAGTPALVTGWSGNADFSDLPGVTEVGFELVPPRSDQPQYNLPGAVWADPDEAAAAEQLSKMTVPDAARRSAIAAAAEERFSPEKWVAGLSPAFHAVCETQ